MQTDKTIEHTAPSETPSSPVDDRAVPEGPTDGDQRELFASGKRHKLPDERASITHKFSIAGHEGYIIVGMYRGGTPGEIFIKMAKEGSTLSGFMDGLALSISIGLQYGVPLKALVDKLTNTRFEPSGFTENPDIRYASSVLDYLARWLGGKFISPEYLKPRTGLTDDGGSPPPINEQRGKSPRPDSVGSQTNRGTMGDAPSCSTCGMLMVPNGSCYKCTNCGGTSGCS